MVMGFYRQREGTLIMEYGMMGRLFKCRKKNKIKMVIKFVKVVKTGHLCTPSGIKILVLLRADRGCKSRLLVLIARCAPMINLLIAKGAEIVCTSND